MLVFYPKPTYTAIFMRCTMDPIDIIAVILVFAWWAFYYFVLEED
jgi:hypothetical protein